MLHSKRWWLICLALFSMPFAFAFEPATLRAIHVQTNATTAEINFTLSKKTLGRIQFLNHPYRVNLFLTNTVKNFDMHYQAAINALVQNISISALSNKTLQLTMQIAAPVDAHIAFLPVKDQTELQLTLNKRIGTIVATPALTYHAKKPVNKALQQTFAQAILDDLALQKASLALPHKKPFIYTVVIDPGHGGKDPGAIGRNGSMEKNVVLHIAEKLASKINHDPNMHAYLTRKGDYFISLRKRLQLAHRYHANLFIAIHADAYFDNSATGASVYALSQHGATSEAAHWLAERDNYSELGNIALNSLPNQSVMVRSVLLDLAQTVTIQDSILLGNIMLDKIDDISKLHHLRVEQAPFMVLKSPDIPSILIETGFITNPREERRLVDAAYQAQLATAIAQGINSYVGRKALTDIAER